MCEAWEEGQPRSQAVWEERKHFSLLPCGNEGIDLYQNGRPVKA